MSGRRKQRDDRPFPPDLIRDEHAYLNNFGGSVFAPISEKFYDPFHMSPNDISRHYHQTRHAGNPYIVHSGRNANQHEQSFISPYEEQQQPPLMAFTLPSLSQSTSDYGSSKSNLSRRRNGSFSNSASPKPTPYTNDDSNHGPALNAFHQRSRSSSGGYRQVKIPPNGLKSSHYIMYNTNKSTAVTGVGYSSNSQYQSEFGYNDTELNASSSTSKNKQSEQMNRNNNSRNINEPIYSEPLPPLSSQVKEAEHRKNIKYFPDPNDPVQISNHIYEYLVKKSKSSENGRISHQQQPPLPPIPHSKRCVIYIVGF